MFEQKSTVDRRRIGVRIGTDRCAEPEKLDGAPFTLSGSRRDARLARRMERRAAASCPADAFSVLQPVAER